MSKALTLEEQGQALFILALLRDQFGGSPALGVSDDGEYVVVATCACDKCVEFRNTYPIKPNLSVLGAAKSYGDAKLCHQQTLDSRQQGELVH